MFSYGCLVSQLAHSHSVQLRSVAGRQSCPMFFFFQAEDGIRDLVRSRGLGDVYKRQRHERSARQGEPMLAECGTRRYQSLHMEHTTPSQLSLIHI